VVSTKPEPEMNPKINTPKIASTENVLKDMHTRVICPVLRYVILGEVLAGATYKEVSGKYAVTRLRVHTLVTASGF
jgi:hypothetical protein